jgi:hypothetical protein
VSKKFLAVIKFPSLSTAPTGSAGEVYYDSANNKLKWHNGTSWQDFTSGGTASNSFETISTPSGTSPVADSSTDTLTLSAGTYLTITGNSTTDTITFATNATSANTASTLVARDANGDFTAGDITADQFLSTNNGNGTNFKLGDDAWIGDINTANTTRIMGVQDATQGYLVFGNSNATALGRTGTGALTYGGNTVWHAGNDGAGSGLDADTLDGTQASAFALLSGASFTGSISTTGDVSASGQLKSTFSSGDEGGEVFLSKSVTNTVLTTGVTIDVFQNRLRIYETGGTNRGYYIDISSGGSTVGTNLVGLTNPMTTAGDIIYGGTSGTPTRLGIGATSQALVVSGGVPAWSYVYSAVSGSGISATNNTLSLDAELQAIAGLTSAADRLPYFTGSGTASLATFTSFGRSLLDDADASAARTTLGLGTMATAATSDYAALSGATFTGAVTINNNLTLGAADVLIFEGTTDDGFETTITVTDPTADRTITFPNADGTVALTSNLASYQPLDADLTAIAGLTSAADRLPYFTGSGTASLAVFTSFARTLLDDSDAATARTTLGVPKITLSDTAPASPVAGDFWFESDTGETFIYYDSSWVSIDMYGASDGNPLNKMVSGRYYGFQHIGGPLGVTNTNANNRMIAQPFYVEKTVTFDRYAIEVTTAVASSSIKLLIYSDSNGLPNSLVLNAGTVDSSTTGTKELTISQSLTGGQVYWLVLVSNSNPQVRAINTANAMLIAPTTFNPAANYGSYYADSTGSYTTPPSTFPTITGTLNYPNRIGLRVA